MPFQLIPVVMSSTTSRIFKKRRKPNTCNHYGNWRQKVETAVEMGPGPMDVVGVVAVVSIAMTVSLVAVPGLIVAVDLALLLAKLCLALSSKAELIHMSDMGKLCTPYINLQQLDLHQFSFRA